jgi:hypothetical protein
MATTLRTIGYNTSANLSKRSKIKEHFLTVTSINTSDPGDYKYIFGIPKYDNKSIYRGCFDPSSAVYISDVIQIDAPIRVAKADTYILDPTTYAAEIEEALEHYTKNQTCRVVTINYSESHTNASGIISRTDHTMDVDVHYPLSNIEVREIKRKLSAGESLTQIESDGLKTVLQHYLGLMTPCEGKTVDEFISIAGNLQKILGECIQGVIDIVCPDFDKFQAQHGLPALAELEQIKNMKRQSFLALKYGKIPLRNPIDGSIAEKNLFKGFFLNANNYDLERADPSQQYNQFEFEVNQNYLFSNLKEIVAFAYVNPANLLYVMVHEFAHILGAGNSYGVFPLGIRFSPQSIDLLDAVFPKAVIVNAFKHNNRTVPQPPYTTYNNSAMENKMFGEYLADLLSVLVLEYYVLNYCDSLQSKYDAIVNATQFACFNGENNMVAEHPPNSMRLNLIFTNKILHDIYNLYTSSRRGAKPVIGGRKRKTRRSKNRRANRKTTHRRRR